MIGPWSVCQICKIAAGNCLQRRLSSHESSSLKSWVSVNSKWVLAGRRDWTLYNWNRKRGQLCPWESEVHGNNMEYSIRVKFIVKHGRVGKTSLGWSCEPFLFHLSLDQTVCCIMLSVLKIWTRGLHQFLSQSPSARSSICSQRCLLQIWCMVKWFWGGIFK